MIKWIFILILLISCNKEEDMLFQSMLPSGENISNNTVKVLLLTGQSNAMGTADNINATTGELTEYTDVKIWSKINSQFENLKFGVDGNNLSWTNGTAGHYYHSLELGLAINKDLYYPDEDIYIIKFAIGGEELSEMMAGGIVYDDFYPNYVVDGINSLINDGYTPEVQFIFAQGEKDAASNPQVSDYRNKFGEWLDLWRSNLGIELNITGLQIMENVGGGTAQVNSDFAFWDLNDNYYEILPTKNLDSWDDIWHYSYQGFKDISILAWNIISNNTWLSISNLLELPSDVTIPSTGTLNSVTGYTRAQTFNYTIGGDDVTSDSYMTFRIYNYGERFEIIRANDSNVTISGGVFIVTDILVEDLTTYSFTIAEIDEAGNYSNQSNAVVVDIDTHPHVGTLTNSNITSNSVDISCTATDNLGVTGFQIFIDSVYSETVLFNELITYTVSGLSTGTNYDIYVVAEDVHGNESGNSNTINFTTL